MKLCCTCTCSCYVVEIVVGGVAALGLVVVAAVVDLA